MAGENIYLNNRYMGERPDAYGPDGFYPVYLGDVLGDRYQVFRKLGTGSQCTVWLARDKKSTERRFVVVKVFNIKSSSATKALVDSLHPLSHPGKKHIEAPSDSFTIHGTRGDHFCEVVEPLGFPLIGIIDEAYFKRSELNEPTPQQQLALEGDAWSGAFAKRACWQMLSALDYLHKSRVAHRDIRSSNTCFALDYDLSARSENKIQEDVWPDEPKKEEQAKPTTKEESSDSDDSDDDPPEQWELDYEECKKRTAEYWKTCDQGDKTAEPHSDAWNKANFYNSRNSIELIHRRDGKPLGSDEIPYTVGPTALPKSFELGNVTDPEKSQTFRLVLTDLGFASPFEECEKHPTPAVSDYIAPEGLLRLPYTEKADIYSLGLWFWEVVMLRNLVEGQSERDDPEEAILRGRQLHSLARRLGPIPADLRAHWPAADKYVDAEGNALDNQQELEEEVYPEDPFPRGDIWDHAKRRKPRDMSDKDMEAFVRLVQKMLQWNPEKRPSTAELLKDEWFAAQVPN